MENPETTENALYGTSSSSSSCSSKPLQKVFPPLPPAPDSLDVSLGMSTLSPHGKAKDAEVLNWYRKGRLKVYRKFFIQDECDLAQSLYDKDPKQSPTAFCK